MCRVNSCASDNQFTLCQRQGGEVGVASWKASAIALVCKSVDRMLNALLTKFTSVTIANIVIDVVEDIAVWIHNS